MLGERNIISQYSEWYVMYRDSMPDSTHKITGISTTPVAIVRNQKILLHPKNWDSTPPNKGPNAGPIIAPAWKIAKNFPLSLGSAISETEPAPIEITADPPVAYTHTHISAQSPFIRYDQ
jgi:hypothetical protein